MTARDEHAHALLRADTPAPAARPAAGPSPSLALASAMGNAAFSSMIAGQPTRRAVLREPAAPASAAGVDTALVGMLDACWPDGAWKQGRLALDFMRPVPGLGLLTGLAADLMAAWDDFAAVPTGDPVVFAVTEGLIALRSLLNIVSNGAQGLLEIGQLAQLALEGLTAAEVFFGVTAPAAILTGAEALALLGGNLALGSFMATTAEGMAWLDGMITLEATIFSFIGPINDRDDWADLAFGYLANTLADIITVPIAIAGVGSGNHVPSGLMAAAVDSIAAWAKSAGAPRAIITAAIKAFWNVQGGDLLKLIPMPGGNGDGGLEPTDPQTPAGPDVGFDSFSVAREPAPGADADADAGPEWRAARAVELAAMRACHERGEEFLGSAAGDWAELLGAGAAMAQDSAGGPEAIEALREQLPTYALELESRVAVVEDVAGRLGGSLEGIDTLQGQLDGLLATLDGASLPLDQLPEGEAGDAMRIALDPLAAALAAAKDAALAPLRDLLESLPELRAQLQLIAAAAEQTIAMFRDALGRVAEAIARCDEVSEIVDVLADESAALASGGGDVAIDETLQEWHALGPEIDAAQQAATA